jgi:peptide/nickel transport system permease protein
MAAPRPEAALPGTGFLAPGPRRLPPAGVSPGRLRSQRLGRALRLWVPAGIVLLILATCFVLPLLTRLPSPTNGNILDAGEPPFSPGHWLGTDPVGVDVFSQLVYGGQVAFEVGLAVTAIGVVVGGLLGITAGYFGGWVDGILSRVVDILIAFPALVLALAIAEGLGPSEVHVIWALSAFSIPAFGRLARGATLVVRDLPFMVAARLAGTRRLRVLTRHVLPNIVPGIATFSLLGIGIVIILEGALDYLGYGIPPPTASWGAMIASGQQVLTAQPEYVLIPSIVLVIVVAALNMLGDALRERWGVR